MPLDEIQLKKQGMDAQQLERGNHWSIKSLSTNVRKMGPELTGPTMVNVTSYERAAVVHPSRSVQYVSCDGRPSQQNMNKQNVSGRRPPFIERPRTSRSTETRWTLVCYLFICVLPTEKVIMLTGAIRGSRRCLRVANHFTFAICGLLKWLMWSHAHTQSDALKNLPSFSQWMVYSWSVNDNCWIFLDMVVS